MPRERDVARAAGVLADGGSVLVTGPVGVGTESVARLLMDRCGPAAGTAVVVGTEGLRDHPLAAVGVAGLLPTMGGASDPAEAVGRALTALSVRRAGATLVVLVENAPALDPFSCALLAGAVRRGIAQLIVPATEGLPVGELVAALDAGLLTPTRVAPMAPRELAKLAGDDASREAVERAVAAADGNRAWFTAMLDADWFAQSPPVPPRLREMADRVLSNLSAPVMEVMLVATVAGLVPLEVLVAATDPDATQQALDAGLLAEHNGVARVRHRLIRMRLEERAKVRLSALRSRVRRAAAEVGTDLPLPEAGQAPDAGLLAGLATVVPAEVAAHLDTVVEPLPPGTRLVHAQALLASGRVNDATTVLRGLVPPASQAAPIADEEVMTEATMTLAYVRAHEHGDVEGATAIIQRTAGLVGAPDLRVRLCARQVSVDAYGAHAGVDALLEEWEGSTWSPRTELEVAKARSLVEWSRRATLPDELAPRILRLLKAVGAGPGERWASLAAVFWLTAFTTGVPEAWEMAEAEVQRARDQGDLGSVGAWYALQTGTLTLAGHSREAAALGARADAALVNHDVFGVRPIALAFSALALRRSGRAGEAGAALARARELVGPDSLLTHAVAAVADLRPGDQAEQTGERWVTAESLFDQLGRPMLVWSTWRGAQHPAATPVELSVAARSDTGVDGRLRTIERAVADEALASARDLIDKGHLALTLAALRRRAVTCAEDPPTARLQQQHLRWVLAVEVEPAGAASAVTASVPDVVSDRQLEIAVKAAAGLADREIADVLSLSVRTVSNHLSRVYRATGVTDRQELARLLPPVDVWRPALS